MGGACSDLPGGGGRASWRCADRKGLGICQQAISAGIAYRGEDEQQMIAWAKRREILVGGVILAVLFLAAAWARADGPGWSAWYSTAGLKGATGITFSTDSGHVIGDLPVIDKLPFGPLEF